MVSNWSPKLQLLGPLPKLKLWIPYYFELNHAIFRSPKLQLLGPLPKLKLWTPYYFELNHAIFRTPKLQLWGCQS